MRFFSMLTSTLLIVCLFGEAFSWTSSGINPSVATRGVEKFTKDPSTALQNFLDGAGAIRFCDIGTTKYGRGLVATKDMVPGETAVKIPLSETILVEQNGEEESISDAWAGKLAQQLVKQQTTHNAYSKALPPPPPTPARGDWSIQAIETLECDKMLNDIQEAKDWRNQQWERYGQNDGALGDQQRFLDAIDLVSSRTIRCGSKFMLVPFVDMANHASRNEGGGYFSFCEHSEMVELRIGDRGVKAGEEVCLDYGDRTNEEWLMHYGFLPNRNAIESVMLSGGRRINWENVPSDDFGLQQECQMLLDESSTSLNEDRETLRRLENDGDITMVLALQYRIARKTLLSAVAGAKASSAFSSAFL